MLKKIKEIFSIPDLRKKIFIVAGLLVFFRLLSAIPLPGVNIEALKNLLEANNMFGLMNIFSGGSFDNMSIALLGVGPYITSTIILQLLTMIFPRLKEIYYEEGAAGRAKFNKLSRFLTLPLAVIQTYSLLAFLVSQGVMPAFGFLDFTLWLNILTAVAGSMILLWVGELIDEQKLGNGVSLIILAGIVSGFPSSIKNVWFQVSQGLMGIESVLIFAVLALVVTAAVVFINRGEHKIPVTYPKRARGGHFIGGASSYLPIRVNQAGVIPIIFAIAIMSFPQMAGQIIASIFPNGAAINETIIRFMNNQIAYGVIYFLLVLIFTYFYTTIVFDSEEVSKNLARSGGFVPGIRPGEPTSDYISAITSKVTLFGAVSLAMIAILPIVTQAFIGQSFRIGGTTLLIVVSVALESVGQIDSQVKMREYDPVV